MKRRWFIRGTVGSILGSRALQAEEPLQDTPAPSASPSLMSTPAVVMAPRSDGANVVWAVRRLARGWVEWNDGQGGEGKAASDEFGFVPQSNQIFNLRLSGLKPGTVYRVRAVVEAADAPLLREESAWKTFRTLDPDAAQVRFAVWNDTHERDETIQRLHEVTPEADFLLWNGDTCNNWVNEERIIPTLLHPGGQDISQGRPLFVTWGNHDVRGKWAYKMPQCVATPQGRPFYAFRHGPVAFLCLHTGEDKPDSHPSFGGRVAFAALRQEQAEWLREVTRQPEFRDAPYKVVLCHIPLRWTNEVAEVDYENGGYDHYARACRDAWHETLVAWGAQVVISGHTHRPGWIPANAEFPYAQLVSGGPEPARARWIEGTADGSGFTLAVRDLEGAVTHEARFAPS